MSYFVVDVEADGPCPGLYSLVSFAAVRFDADLTTVFEGRVRPVFDDYIPHALAVSKVTREEHLAYPEPGPVFARFAAWIAANNQRGRPQLISDNPAFDWQFINWYFIKYSGSNPFGHTAKRIGDIYAGLKGDMAASGRAKRYRKTTHTHDPLDDARGNAEILQALQGSYGLKGLM